MNTRPLLVLTLLFPLTVVADDMDLIGTFIDGFQDAAAHGNKDRYLGLMTDDGVFMGTDEWER